MRSLGERWLSQWYPQAQWERSHNVITPSAEKTSLGLRICLPLLPAPAASAPTPFALFSRSLPISVCLSGLLPAQRRSVSVSERLSLSAGSLARRPRSCQPLPFPPALRVAAREAQSGGRAGPRWLDTPSAALRPHRIRARRRANPGRCGAGGDARRAASRGRALPLRHLHRTPRGRPHPRPALRLQAAGARTGGGAASARLLPVRPPRARRATMRARPQVCEALLFALALQTGVCYGIKWL